MINICGGFALDRIFIPAGTLDGGARTGRKHAGLQFTSLEDPADLTSAVANALVGMGCDIESHAEGTKVKATKLTAKGMIGISAYVYVLTSTVCLLEFKRGKGDLLEFRDAYVDLVENRLAKFLRKR